ncbi:MAG: ATP-binding cassette domain-containing protein [Desulfovibrio sp.]|jgi:NitT/TauT family transport system ATP-binding protein|nr:ATP-binding cassette domain-containing protein [Desulfovibrio sp.]
MLELANVCKSFAGKTVIRSATLSLRAGEVICLTGPSGTGKTTLLEIMAGVISPDGGRVKRSGAAALMFQDDVLIPWLTAERAVAYILPVPEKEGGKIAAARLKQFGLERGLRPGAMSGGMRRRLSLARTLAAERPILLLDEPFAFLDAAWIRVVCEEIAAQAGAGRGVVIATHVTEPLDVHLSGVARRDIAIASLPLCIR